MPDFQLVYYCISNVKIGLLVDVIVALSSLSRLKGNYSHQIRF